MRLLLYDGKNKYVFTKFNLEAKFKYRKAFTASNYGKCFKGTHIKYKNNLRFEIRYFI